MLKNFIIHHSWFIIFCACWLHCCTCSIAGHKSRRCIVATDNRKTCWCNLWGGIVASCAAEAIPACNNNPQYCVPTLGIRAKSANATHLLTYWRWICNLFASASLASGVFPCWIRALVVVMPQFWSWDCSCRLNPGNCPICQSPDGILFTLGLCLEDIPSTDKYN